MLSKYQQPQVEEHIRRIRAFLNPYPLSPRLATKIYRAYGDDSVQRIRQNPYALARDVAGIGEQTATEIARVVEEKLGRTYSHPSWENPNVPKYHHGGPGNGKLSTADFERLKAQLQKPPRQVLPAGFPLTNPHHWTIPDLKRAAKYWFDVSWAHESSYRSLFKKCGLIYCRRDRCFIPASRRS